MRPARLLPLLSVLPAALVLTLAARAAEPAFYEPLQFVGPTRDRLFRVPVGETIVLTAGTGSAMQPVLHGGDTEQIRCLPAAPTDRGSVQWSCRALRTGSARNEVFFTVGERKSRILVLVVDPPEDRQLSLPPKARYPDPVLGDIASFRNPFPDTVMWTLEGQSAAELWRRDALGGYPPGGEFRGFLPVNRAEAAKILLQVRTIDIPDASPPSVFSDVPASQWFAPYVARAAAEGIIFGYGDGSFRPERGVSTAEFLAMLARTFDLPLAPNPAFADIPADAWYASYAGIAQRYELFPGRADRLLPDQPLTRAEVAVALYRYLAGRE